LQVQTGRAKYRLAMAYLVQRTVDGAAAEQWELADKPLIFGRGEQADCRIQDDRVSRQHFAVVPKDGGYILQDLKSTNGTYVNNERVGEAKLRPNDKVRVGQTMFVFLTEKPKGLSTIMGEIEAEGKGLRTYLGEMSGKDPTK
jgi:pSer/pThr/pTyr-binding forkhead associated (FHA) protein